MSAAGESRRSKATLLASQQQFSVRSKSSSIASLATSVSIVSAASGASAESDADCSQYTATVVRRATPILFSTNRGLHLRVARGAAMTETACRETASKSRVIQQRRILLSASAYNITFCDLERWSTNRANTVSLHDPQVLDAQHENDNNEDVYEEKAYATSSSTSARTLTIAGGSLRLSNYTMRRAQAQVHFDTVYSLYDHRNPHGSTMLH